MRILYLSQYFPPEIGATQTRAIEMATGLVQAGHQVTMICEVPNHPHGLIPESYRGKLFERTKQAELDVIRVWVKTTPEKTMRTRLMFYISYMIMAILAGLVLARGKYDVIYATSPPLFVGGAALMLSKLRRIPLVFEVRDLWPESAVALGELRNERAIRYAKWLEEACYRQAKKIVVVTQGIMSRLVERGVSHKKLFLIPNGANTTLFYPQPEAGRILRKELGLDKKFIVLYAGIHGIAQGLEMLIDAAKHLQHEPAIHFLFVGEGPRKNELIEYANGLHLHNISFHAQVQREEMPDFLSMTQVATVPLRKLDLFQGALPSKMFDAWACACPTLITVDGEARHVLQRAEAGVWVEPENVEMLVDTIYSLYQNQNRLCELGENGQRFVTTHYSRQVQAAQLETLLKQL